MMTFNDFFHKYNLKIRATSNLKGYEVFKKIGLDKILRFYLSDSIFSTNFGKFNLHPNRGTPWVCYIKDCYFDIYGFTPPKKFLKSLKNTYGKCISSEYQIQKNGSLCGSLCLYISSRTLNSSYC